MKRWTGPADIAYCAEHGLHGARDTCFECGKRVEQIRMVAVTEHLADVLGDEAVEKLAKRFWELRTLADSLPAWSELTPAEQQSKRDNARQFLATLSQQQPTRNSASLPTEGAP